MMFLLRRYIARSTMRVTAMSEAMMSNQMGQPAASMRVNTQRLQKYAENPRRELYLVTPSLSKASAVKNANLPSHKQKVFLFTKAVDNFVDETGR